MPFFHVVPQTPCYNVCLPLRLDSTPPLNPSPLLLQPSCLHQICERLLTRRREHMYHMLKIYQFRSHHILLPTQAATVRVYNLVDSRLYSSLRTGSRSYTLAHLTTYKELENKLNLLRDWSGNKKVIINELTRGSMLEYTV